MATVDMMNFCCNKKKSATVAPAMSVFNLEQIALQGSFITQACVLEKQVGVFLSYSKNKKYTILTPKQETT